MTPVVRVGSFLLAVFACGALVSQVATATGDPQSGKRVVRIGVLNPVPGVAESQITTKRGKPASFKIDDVGSFKFVPSLTKGDDKNVLLQILDADSGKQIDQLRLIAGGEPVKPKGLPFQVKVIAVTTPK